MSADIETRIFGSESNGGIGMEVDKTFLAGRIALKPTEYAGSGVVLGHYSVAQLSGAIAATPTALDAHASIRWASSERYLVLKRIKVCWGVISAITAGVRMAYQASIVRGFTVDFTTASTAANMGTPSKTNAMRNSMNSSLMATAGPRICTTTVMSGHTYTLDANPFAITTWPMLTATNSTGTAVALPVGAGGNMQTLYECTANGEHPVVLSQNEGVVLQITHTGHASGTISLATMWQWAEVLVW